MLHEIDKILEADSKHIGDLLRPESISLTVTSPPYRNAIDYQRHVENLRLNEGHYYRGKERMELRDYLKGMQQVFDEVLKLTKPGGFCAIVIGNEVVNGTIIPLAALLLSTLLGGGAADARSSDQWSLHEEIIWNKVTGGTNRFGVTVRNHYPTNFRANIMHEHILVLRKGSGHLRKSNSREDDFPLNSVMKREIANSVWNIAPVPPNYLRGHPCPFPEQIPWRLIMLYTYPGDTILDPFNGSGQTTKVAKRMGRHYFGVDILPDYVKLAKKRLKEPLHLSKNFIIPRWELERWDDALVKT